MAKPRSSPARYRRIILKLSGESLQSSKKGYGIDCTVTHRVAAQIQEIQKLGVEVGVVIGGGNIFRGTGATAQIQGIDRTTADYMGMLATVINALALQDALEKQRCFTRVLTAIQMEELAEPYIRRRAIRHLQKGRVVILAGGTGNPYFSTDTAAALRGVEIGAQALLKATKVDGVYSADPLQNRRAKRFTHLRYIDVLNKGLKVMDATAVTLCMDHRLPIVIFSLGQSGNIRRVVLGQKIGTTIQ